MEFILVGATSVEKKTPMKKIVLMDDEDFHRGLKLISSTKVCACRLKKVNPFGFIYRRAEGY